MIQLTRSGVVADARQLAPLRAAFAQCGCVCLPALLEPVLLRYLLKYLAAANFVVKTERDNNAEPFGEVLFMPQTEPALFLFHLLCNRPQFFQLVQQITGCSPIGNFFGRIHRSLANAPHHIDWHDDNADHRLVGLQINLSTEAYSGGLFQLRERHSARLLCELGNVGLGSGFLFRLGSDVQHRLTPIEGPGSRTVGVGWFRAQPDWRAFAASFFTWPQNALATAFQQQEDK